MDEERIRLAKEVLMIKLIDTIYFLEGKIDEQGDIQSSKRELKKV